MVPRAGSSPASQTFSTHSILATANQSRASEKTGRIDLRKNLRGDYREQSIALTTPGIVYKDLIIVGGRNAGDASRAAG